MSTTTTTLLARLQALRDNTAQSWQQCVDTCHDDQGVIDAQRQQAAREDMDSAMADWDAAIDAVERDALGDARADLEQARRLASEWGDDQFERQALDLIAEAKS